MLLVAILLQLRLLLQKFCHAIFQLSHQLHAAITAFLAFLYHLILKSL